MNQNRKARKVAALIMLLLALTGCAHRVNGGPPVTAFEQAMTYHASLATTNDELAKALVNAQQLNVISAKDVALVTEVQVKIARADEQLDAILKQGQQASLANADQIKLLIGSMQTAANSLASSGVFGNDKNLAAIAQDASAIVALSNNLLTTLQAAGVLK